MKVMHKLSAQLLIASIALAACSTKMSSSPIPRTLSEPQSPSGNVARTRMPQNITAVPGQLGLDTLNHIPPRTTVDGFIRPGMYSSCLYLTDNLFGITYVYDGQSLQPIGHLTSPNSYGWGVAATNSTIYIGTFADTIDEYKPCSGTSPTSTLKGAGYGYPYGIASFKDGTTYANEFPTNLIDVWSPDGGHRVEKVANEKASYFLALDAQGNLYSAGWNGPATFGIIDRCDKWLKTCTTLIDNITFPGGIAFDKNQNLYVNDQAGTVRELSGCGSTPPKCHLIVSASTPAEFTSIALDTGNRNLYGAANYGCIPSSYYPCGSAIGLLLPLSKQKVGAQTPAIQTALPYGVAYWKPSTY